METRASLLIRVKDPNDTSAWSEFHDLYAPLIYNYARARGLSHDDAEEIRSICYETLIDQMRDFDYDSEKGRFKSWLATLVRRRVIDHWRQRKIDPAETHELRDAAADELSPDEYWEQEWRAQHLVYCVEQARHHVSSEQHQAFTLLAQESLSVEAVAARLDLNANQIYKAKSRVLAVVRELMAKLYSEAK